MSIGQGYTLVTPLQIARFVSALVNGGHLLKPLLVQSQEPVVQHELGLAPSELDFIHQAMVATVEEPHGTAWRLRTKNATIGGKTGTAQVVKLKEEDREKETEEIKYRFRDHAWMASFGHIKGRDYVVVALVEHGGHGSSAAGPIVKAVYDSLAGDEKEVEKEG
jgi:penicillin-binding protein 2